MSSGDRVNPALRVAQLLDGMGEEYVLGVVGGRLHAAAGGEQAELHAAVHVGEQPPPILEVEQTHQRLRSHNILKEELGRIVGCDSGREHATHTTEFVHNVSHRLREHGIGVDVASPTQGIAPGVTHQVAPPLGLSHGVEERPVELGVIVRNGSNHALPRRRVGRVRDLRASLREPLLFLELYRAPTADSPARSRNRRHPRPRTLPETPDASGRTGTPEPAAGPPGAARAPAPRGPPPALAAYPS